MNNSQSKKYTFNFVSKLLGNDSATNIKAFMWNSQIKIKKKYEFIMGKFFNDNI